VPVAIFCGNDEFATTEVACWGRKRWTHKFWLLLMRFEPKRIMYFILHWVIALLSKLGISIWANDLANVVEKIYRFANLGQRHWRRIRPEV